MEISISLDPAAHGDLDAYVAEVNTWNGVTMHCDIMDGRLVERIAMSETQLKNVLRAARVPVDVHFMACDVDHWLAETPKTANLRSVSFQIEPFLDAPEKAAVLLEKIRRERGCLAGIAIDLPTEVAAVPESLVRDADVIIVMSAKAGKSGQAFNPNALLKVAEIRRINPTARLIIDCGINEGNIALVKIAGFDVAAIGSAIYNASDRAAAVEAFKCL